MALLAPVGKVAGALILKRGSASCSSGEWRDDDFDVLENGVVVGRIFCLDAVGPQGRPWMWASGHNGDIKRAAHGYEPTRERSGVRPSPYSWVGAAWLCRRNSLVATTVVCQQSRNRVGQGR